MSRCLECGPCQEYILAPANAGRCTGKPRVNWASAPQAARKRPKLCVTVDPATIEALEAEYTRLGGAVSKGVIVERWLEAWQKAARRVQGER